MAAKKDVPAATEEVKDAAELSAAATPEFVTAATVPTGYTATKVLRYIEGALHQAHDAPHDGTEPARVFVAVPGQAKAEDPEQAAE